MTATDTELDNTHPQPSEALVLKIDEINDGIKNGEMWYERAKNAVYDAYTIAVKDGFSPLQAGDYIRQNCNNKLSASTLQRILPKDAKHNTVRLNKGEGEGKDEVRNSNVVTRPLTPESLVAEMKPMQVVHVDSICDADVRKMDDVQLPYGRIEPKLTLSPTREDIPTEIEADERAQTEPNEDRFRDEIEDLKRKISEDYVHKDIHSADLELIDDLKLEIIRKGTEVKEAIDAANKIAEVRGLEPPTPKDTEETVAALRQQVAELQEIINKGMKVEFNTASNLPASTSQTEPTIAGMVEFPADLFGRFFIATRNTKDSLFLEIREGKVVSWDSK